MLKQIRIEIPHLDTKKTVFGGYFGTRPEIIVELKKDAKAAYRKDGIYWKNNGKTFHVVDEAIYTKEQLEQIIKFGKAKGRKKYFRRVYVNGEEVTDFPRPDYEAWAKEF
jgi:hypothetical protein